MPSIDKDAAAVLNAIPDEGATVANIATQTGINAQVAAAAVQRLLNLKLVEANGAMIYITPFAQKARKVFNITE